MAPVTGDHVRGLASGLVIETTFPLLTGYMLVMGSVSPRSHAELPADQIRAAHAFLPPPYRERAIALLEAGRHGVIFCQEA